MTLATDAALMLLSDAEARKLEMYRAEIESITATWTTGALASDAEDAALAELMLRGAAATKELERTRKAAVEPLNRQVKTINGAFGSLTDQLEALRERGDRQRRAWRAQVRAREDRERAEAQRQQIEAAEREAQALALAEAAPDEQARAVALEAAEEASADQAVAVLAEPAPLNRGTRTDSGTASWRKVWKVEVVDAALVPREYLMVDEPKLRAAVKGGVRVVPGCNITEEEESTLRPGR